MGNMFNSAKVDVKKATKDSAGAGLPVLGRDVWQPVDKGYHDMIAAKAAKYGVPADLAIRQAAQESAFFNPAVISGQVKSGAGATGLFQFMPATAKALKVDPTNPEASAEAAMGYMAYLYKKFKSWKTAVWAYNWGEGNVAKYLAGQKSALPKETRIYGLIVAEGYAPTAAKALPVTVK